MDDKELRLRCVELAIQLSAPTFGNAANQIAILKLANLISSFLDGAELSELVPESKEKS